MRADEPIGGRRAILAADAVGNRGCAAEKQILLRAGRHLGDTTAPPDGEPHRDGARLVARIEGIVQPVGLSLCDEACLRPRDRLAEPLVGVGDTAAAMTLPRTSPARCPNAKSRHDNNHAPLEPLRSAELSRLQ